MRRIVSWPVVAGGSAAVDWLVRFGTGFDMPRVLAFETVLFPLTAAALEAMRRKGHARRGSTPLLQLLLVWTFALAGLRSALLTAGSSYVVANLAPVVVAGAALLLVLARRRSRGTEAEP
ncbi:MAG: hypothetical protein R6X22_06875 [Gemmatimonadota bacterium]